MRDTTFYSYLVIPSEVNYVNFTWKSGRRKYSYDFDRLQTMDESILKAPTLSIKKSGRIPQEQKSKCNHESISYGSRRTNVAHLISIQARF